MYELYADQIQRRRTEKQQKRLVSSAAGGTDALFGTEEGEEGEQGEQRVDTLASSGAVSANSRDMSNPEAEIPYVVTISAESSNLTDKKPWYTDHEFIYTSTSEAKAAGLWSFPSTELETAKCHVFRDLWERGYFMGGGVKFGGDFLVYPGEI